MNVSTVSHAHSPWHKYSTLLLVSLLLLSAGQGRGEPLLTPDSGRYVVDERRSGYTYLSEESQRLQDDAFANPGMLWAEQGHQLWSQIEGTASLSCASCHTNATTSMRGVRTRYPRFVPELGTVINLEQQINSCRTKHMQAPPYAYESAPLLALTTFVSIQSRGLAMAVQIDGPAQPFFAAGQAFYRQRRGQLDLSCAHCHEQHAGQRLRGEVISQGHSNGFPVYRHLWQTLASTHRMFAWCNTAVRAEPYPLGSQEYVNLELFLAWRSRGLAVETPAVRR